MSAVTVLLTANTDPAVRLLQMHPTLEFLNHHAVAYLQGNTRNRLAGADQMAAGLSAIGCFSSAAAICYALWRLQLPGAALPPDTA